MTYHQANWLIDLHKTCIGRKFNGRYIKKLLIAPIHHGKILAITALLLNQFTSLPNLEGYEEFDVFVIYDHLEGIANGTFLSNAYSSFFSFFEIQN